MTKEDLEVMPLALIGLAKGIGNVIIKPMLMRPVEMGRELLQFYQSAQAIREQGIIGGTDEEFDLPGSV